MTHEAAHVAQISYDLDLCKANPDEACGWPPPTWGTEGGADFLAHEVTRRSQSFPFDGNTVPPFLPLLETGAVVSPASAPGTYWFPSGYQGSEWFMRDLLQRAVALGRTYDEALPAVARATYLPWYGWVRNRFFDRERLVVVEGPPRHVVAGLVPAVRDVLGESWDPVEGLLLAGITQAVDDRTDNPELQNVTLGNAHELWFPGPFAEIELGTGEARAIGTFGWTFGWAEIDDRVGDGILSFGASEPGIHWIIARTR